MSFRPATTLANGRTLRWRPRDGSGDEVATLHLGDGEIAVRSSVRGDRDGHRFDLTYTLTCSAAFETTALTVAHADGRRLDLRRSDGRWIDGRGDPLPAFDDCADPDLAWSPLTNTLPIRRLAWEAGMSRRLAVLYLPLDRGEPRREEQVYTCLDPRLFRFETADAGFSALVSVDEDGFVTDYPDLFERLGTADR